MGNQSTFPCVGCHSRSPFKFGDPDSKILRTFGTLRKLNEDYNASKLIKKSTKPADFFNVIYRPLFEGCQDDAWIHDVLTIAGKYCYVVYLEYLKETENNRKFQNHCRDNKFYFEIFYFFQF